MSTECMICKAANSEEASFCNNCGARLGKRPGEAPTEHAVPKPQGLPEAMPHPGSATHRPRTLPEDTETSPTAWADPRSSGWSLSHPAAQPSSTSSLRGLLAVVNDFSKRALQENKPEGEVRRFAELVESDSRGRPWCVRTFLLQSFDEVGNRQPPVQVEMRALRFDGWINEGDEVVITNLKRRGGRILASEVRNKTTRTIVKAKGSSMWPPPGWVWNLIWLIGIILVVYWLSTL